MPWYRQLHWQIISGLILGLIWGIFASFSGFDTFTENYIAPFGDIFVRLLQLIAVPLVIASLIVGVTNLNDIASLSRMGGKTLGIYVVTTTFAITIGLTVVNIMAPGSLLPEATQQELMASYGDEVDPDAAADEVLDRGPLDFVVNIVPSNFFEAASDNANMLQIVFVALFIGIALMQIPKEKSEYLVSFFDALNDAIIKLVDMIMIVAPIGVFALIAAVIVELAGDDLSRLIELLGALGWYSLAVLFGLLIHAFFIYGAILKIFSGMSFTSFLRGMRPALLFGFSTSSSVATLPITMERVEHALGVGKEVTSFVLPIGATINMDGTSLYQAVAAVFIAQSIGIDLSIAQQLTIVITAVLASIGTAGVPGAGIIMLVIVLQAINVPVEGIALILGVDRILDMCRTAVNITGDGAVSVAIASMEDKLGEPDFYV